MRKPIIMLLFLTFTLSVVATQAQSSASGTLEFRANGEDFVREGFVSKDGWEISFNHVYVALSQIRTYQTNPPYNPDDGELTRSNTMIGLAGGFVVDLKGDEETILVGMIEGVPAGYYNAASWRMPLAQEGEAAGYALVIDGEALRDGESIAFVLRIDREYHYTCGAFIGDERKGVLSDGGNGEIELTFHFDHIFGDAELPADDSLNALAPGFDWLASLAVDNQVDVTLSELADQLAESDYEMLVDILPTLGHTGEGHCHAE